MFDQLLSNWNKNCRNYKTWKTFNYLLLQNLNHSFHLRILLIMKPLKATTLFFEQQCFFPKPIHSPISHKSLTYSSSRAFSKQSDQHSTRNVAEHRGEWEQLSHRLNFRFGTGINQSTLAPVRRNAIKRVFCLFSSVFIFRNVSCRNATRKSRSLSLNVGRHRRIPSDW